MLSEVITHFVLGILLLLLILSCTFRFSFAAAVVTVVVYYLVFHGRNMLNHPLAAEDIFVFGEFSEEVNHGTLQGTPGVEACFDS